MCSPVRKVLIIGGVAAGLKSAAKIRRNDPQAQITVVEKGDVISYGACGMPYYVAGDVDDVKQLMMTPAGVLRNEAYFKNVKDIDILTRSLATKINRQEKSVTVKDLVSGLEKDLVYDKLVIAAGASPVKPPLPGIDLANIFQIWLPSDAKTVREGLEKRKFSKAVIIGAGLIGMEMAEALNMWGIDITVVEMRDQVFPGFLDDEVAAAVHKYAEEKGIHILLGEKVERFNGAEAVQEVVTDQRTIAADLVILAIGAKPNVELAKQAGITLGETGAIAVNEYMQTNDPDIYAGGDCVETTNLVSGRKVFAPMGSTANKHGRIIGTNVCGGQAKFPGVLNTVIVKVLEMNVGKTGLTEKQAKEFGFEYIAVTVAGHDRPHYMPEAKLLAVKLVVEAASRRVIGAQVFGEGEVAKRVDILATGITFGATVDDLADLDLAYAPPYASPIDNVAVAANSAMNKLEGKLKGITAATAKEKSQASEAVLLDVRSPEEFNQIRLADCAVKNIPLGQLRDRLHELDKTEEIVAFCKIGLRGYEAAIILEGEGFNNVKVMEGGIFTWPYDCASGKCNNE